MTMTFKIDTTVDHWHPENLQGVTASARVDTVEHAKAIAAEFPKSVKVRASVLSTTDDDGNRVELGYLTFNARLGADGVNGGVNETGLRRYRAFRKHAARLGFDIDFAVRFGNGIDEATFESMVAA